MSINEIIISNISHYSATRKDTISNSYKSNCTPRSLLPLILRFQGLCEHSYSNRYPGGPQRPPIQTRKSVFTLYGLQRTLTLNTSETNGCTTLAKLMPQNASDHRSAFRSTSHIKLASKQRTRACQIQ